MKDDHEVLNTLLQCSNTPTSSIFIELFDSFLGDNLTLGGFSIVKWMPTMWLHPTHPFGMQLPCFVI